MKDTKSPGQQRILRIATRGSELALWQARWVQARLAEHQWQTELVLIETQGDVQYLPFEQMQGQGFFTKAVQDAVLAKHADLAVHSLKDLPTAPCEGLILAAIPTRATPTDMLLIQPYALDPTSETLPLKPKAVVGTSAARRRAQLQHLRPDLDVQLLRGNVPTRIQKLRDRKYDAIMLAAAGVQRLGLDLSPFHVEELAPERFVPAPGQGALAIECRSEDREVCEALAHIHDPEVAAGVSLERNLMRRFEGGCQLALGVHARINFREHPPVSLVAWYNGMYLSLVAQTPLEAEQEAFQRLSPS